MRKRFRTNRRTVFRTVDRKQLWFYKYNKVIVSVIVAVVIVASSVTGYLAAGRSKQNPQGSMANSAVSVPAEISSDAADIVGIQSFNQSLTRDEQLCETIEKINLQSELESEKARIDELNNEIQSKEDEMNQLEDTILNALMSNFSSQLISRSSGSVSSYAQEARNLIDLSSKLAAFKQTPEAAEIDLTEYEAAIRQRLDYFPTKKPTSGALRGYGYRRHPIYGYSHFHPAVDMTTPTGTPIVAAGAGTITTAGYGRSQGNYIVINHGNGFTTVYMHCSKLLVSAGQRVEKGQKIALVGSTGTSTGSHLHFEIRLHGEPLNPTKMIMQ